MEGVRAGQLDRSGVVADEVSVGSGSVEYEIATDGQPRRRRRHRRRRTLGEKIRHSHKVNRIRRVVTVIVLGAGIIAASVYVARNSVPYDPVPVLPAR